MDAEVTSKVALVTEKEIDEYYNANKARLRGDEAAVRPRIRQQLQQQKLNARQDVFLTSLRSDAKIVDRLEPPLAARVDVAVAGAPVRGAPDARVTVVEFSDFECPFCKRANGTMASLLEKYSGKIKLVYRDFPLENIHPLARRAAEAARCARDGGKFWEYHGGPPALCSPGRPRRQEIRRLPHERCSERRRPKRYRRGPAPRHHGDACVLYQWTVRARRSAGRHVCAGDRRRAGTNLSRCCQDPVAGAGGRLRFNQMLERTVPILGQRLVAHHPAPLSHDGRRTIVRA
jgi:hypothetical protein